MADVSKIQGPGTPPEPGGKKEKQIADEFKKKMQKVEKPAEADTEQKKKRKRREELEDESKPKEAAEAPLSTTFSLNQEEKLDSIFDVKKTARVAGPASAVPQGPRVGASRPPPEIDMPPSVEEENEDELPLPPPLQATPQQQQQQPTSPLPQTPLNEPLNPPQTGQSSTSTEPPPKEREPEKIAGGLPKKKTELHLPGMPVYTLPKKGKKKKKIGETKPLAQKEKMEKRTPEEEALSVQPLMPTPPSKANETYFSEMKKRTEKTSRKVEEEQGSEMTGYLPPQISSEKKGTDEGKKDKKDEKETMPLVSALPGEKTEPLSSSPFLSATAAPGTTPSYAYLHPEVLDLFERMVGVMTVATYSGVSETTISLNSPQFASSVFYGAQIIIREYSTAPKIFNIELLGTPQAVTLFQGNADDLMAAFQNGKYAFRVNQLQTGLLRAEKPLFQRKEKPSKNDKGLDK